MGKHVEIPVGTKVKFADILSGDGYSTGVTISGRVRHDRDGGRWGYKLLREFDNKEYFIYTSFVKVVI